VQSGEPAGRGKVSSLSETLLRVLAYSTEAGRILAVLLKKEKGR